MTQVATDTTVGEQDVIWLGNRLIVVTGNPGWQQCTAKTTRGKRCKLDIQGDQIAGWREILVPDWGELSAYDLGREFEDEDRWLAQRCERHWPDGEAFCDPEWEPFDRIRHVDQKLRPEPPGRGAEWTEETGVVDYGRRWP
jgi:hypothetical protein